ncbi:hypothetical protein Q8A67_020485 [Cirrhinus molitorella]|uniref:Uncharacterized protein n=1 Tax=Cirrhinus molitorella TaxID=172907 RepID=A0AA88PCP6_9TELE|nr:hypothetical protein Q8A67_020485 [Cirrhinus molitorella]
MLSAAPFPLVSIHHTIGTVLPRHLLSFPSDHMNERQEIYPCSDYSEICPSLKRKSKQQSKELLPGDRFSEQAMVLLKHSPSQSSNSSHPSFMSLAHCILGLSTNFMSSSRLFSFSGEDLTLDPHGLLSPLNHFLSAFYNSPQLDWPWRPHGIVLERLKEEARKKAGWKFQRKQGFVAHAAPLFVFFWVGSTSATALLRFERGRASSAFPHMSAVPQENTYRRHAGHGLQTSTPLTHTQLLDS